MLRKNKYTKAPSHSVPKYSFPPSQWKESRYRKPDGSVKGFCLYKYDYKDDIGEVALLFNDNVTMMAFFNSCPTFITKTQRHYPQNDVMTAIDEHTDITQIKPGRLLISYFHGQGNDKDDCYTYGKQLSINILSPNIAFPLDEIAFSIFISAEMLSPLKELLYFMYKSDEMDSATLNDSFIFFDLFQTFTLDDLIWLSENINLEMALSLVKRCDAKDQLLCQLGQHFLTHCDADPTYLANAAICYQAVISTNLDKNDSPEVHEAKLKIGQLKITQIKNTSTISRKELEHLFKHSCLSFARDEKLIASLFHILCGETHSTPSITSFDGKPSQYITIARSIRNLVQRNDELKAEIKELKKEGSPHNNAQMKK